MRPACEAAIFRGRHRTCRMINDGTLLITRERKTVDIKFSKADVSWGGDCNSTMVNVLCHFHAVCIHGMKVPRALQCKLIGSNRFVTT